MHGEDVLRAWVAGHDDRIDPATRVDYGELAQRLANPSPGGTAPLAAIAFLNEVRAAAAGFVAQPLSGAEAFCGLVKYGFGGLPCPAAWRSQFEVYGSLAERTTAVGLAAPEGARPDGGGGAGPTGRIDRPMVGRRREDRLTVAFPQATQDTSATFPAKSGGSVPAPQGPVKPRLVPND